jgi:hypothetical protein
MGRILLESSRRLFAIGSGLRHFPKVQRVHVARSITVGFRDLGRSIAHIEGVRYDASTRLELAQQ